MQNKSLPLQEVNDDFPVVKPISKTIPPQEGFLIPKSAYSKRVQQLIDVVSPTNMTVVITGESGTGKEVVARMIHNASKRKNGPFIPVDCGEIGRASCRERV